MAKTKYNADPKRGRLDEMTQNEAGGKTNTEHQGSNDGKATDRDNDRFSWPNAHWVFHATRRDTRSEVRKP